MTQHIIDTDKLDKLPKYTWSDVGPVPCNRGDYVHIDDLLALIANSPQADGINATREELDRFLRDMRDVKPNPKAQETLSKGRAILRQMEAQADGMVLDVINQCAKIAEKYEPEEKLDYIDYASKEIRKLLSAYKPQADGYGQDFNLEYTCKRIRRLLNALGMSDPSDGKDYVLMGMLFTLLGTICSKLEKPQADDVPPDVYDIVVDTGDGIYHTAEVVHFQQSGSKRMIQVRFGDTQADDVRKDAEPSDDKLKAMRDFAMSVQLSHDYDWIDYMRDMYFIAIDKARE